MGKEFENWPKENWVIMWKVYAIAFAVVIVIIMPWAVGVFQLGRWIFF